MKNTLSIAIFSSIIVILLFFLPQPTLAQEEYVWVLVDQVDFNGNQDVARQGTLSIYDVRASYNPGEYSITKTYVGDFVPGIENCPEKGETATAFATFENIPDIINQGVPVNIDLSLGFSYRWIINYKGGGGGTSVEAFFCSPDTQPMGGRGNYPYFKDSDGNYRLSSNNENGFSNIEKQVSSEIGAGGKKGEQIGLCIRQYFGGITLGTNYIYEWKKPEDVYSEVSSWTNKKYEVPKDENGDYIDSGVRINAVGGEVLIRHGDDPIGWEMVWPDTIIYEGDLIYVQDGDSACSLSLSDMTTFEMGPQSSITVNMQQEDSQIKILAGKIMANVKKMVTTGSMSVEMSQAVAGIKGTIFVVESNDETSTLRVLEGKVELTGKNNGVQLVEAGQEVVAMNGTLGEVKEYSISDELDTWSEETNNKIKAVILERTGSEVKSIDVETNDTEKYSVLIFVIIGLAILVTGTLFFKYKKTKKA